VCSLVATATLPSSGATSSPTTFLSKRIPVPVGPTVGYEEINRYRDPGQSGMFYQLYSLYGASVTKPNSEIPLLIWLQGGPGSSSQFGAHTEVGPIRVEKGKIKENDYSWNLQGHTLFIDSPLNTGFSYSGDRNGDKQVGSTDEATDHLMNFLENFYTTWPALRSSPLYLTGESFAGHYLPMFAWKILNKG
jgi:carboxypeptidase C (cathepsin A)